MNKTLLKTTLLNKTLLNKTLRSDKGLSTAEYAVGTVAVAGLGGLLLRLLTSSWVYDLLQRIIERAFAAIFG